MDGKFPSAIEKLSIGMIVLCNFKNLTCDRFLSKAVADKYDLDVPPYQGIDQIVEVSAEGQKL